jgi:integrase
MTSNLSLGSGSIPVLDSSLIAARDRRLSAGSGVAAGHRRRRRGALSTGSGRRRILGSGDEPPKQSARSIELARPCARAPRPERGAGSAVAAERSAAALEAAVREELIPRNVAKLVRVPAPRYRVNRGLTVPQARATLRAAAAHRLAALYVLALFLGLRRGELLGLRWRDVDLDGGKLEVVQTLQRVGGSLRLVPPKTEGSARTVPLPPVCVEARREHKKRQFAERADAWPDWEDHGLVFPSRRGTPMEPDNLRGAGR